MKKKTLKKSQQSRKKKGGAPTEIFATAIFGEKPGPFVPENISRAIDTGKEKGLIAKYEERKTNAEKDYETINENYEKEEDRIRNESFSAVAWFIARMPIFYQIYQLGKSTVKGIIIIFYSIGSFFAGLVMRSGSMMRRITDIFTKDRGSVLKAVIFILFIILIVFFVLAATSPRAKKDPYAFLSKFPLVNSMQNQGIFAQGATYFNDIIDNNIRAQITGSWNSFHKFFGNDIIGNTITNMPRGTIQEGRNDGLIHLKKAGQNETRVETIVEPKPKQFNINMNDYPEADYHKLPESIREKYLPSSSLNSTLTFVPKEVYNGLYNYTLEEGNPLLYSSSISSSYSSYYFKIIYDHCFDLKLNNQGVFNLLILNFFIHFEYSISKTNPPGDKDKYLNKIIITIFSSYKDNENFKSALRDIIQLYTAEYPDDFNKDYYNKYMLDTTYKDGLYTKDKNKFFKYYFELKEKNIEDEKYQKFLINIIIYSEYNDIYDTYAIIIKNMEDLFDEFKSFNIEQKKLYIKTFIDYYKGPLFFNARANINNIVLPYTDVKTSKGNVYQANDIDINDYLFSDGDNINSNVLYKKMFSYDGSKYIYPDEYIASKYLQ